MRFATPTSDQLTNLSRGLSETAVDGLYHEFGVFKGTTINHIAEFIGQDKTVHGFDWFEGLTTDWMGPGSKGDFSAKGVIPEVRGNVQLHVGLFAEALPPFLDAHAGPASFVHIDCDIYQSTREIFEILEARFVEGSVIVFDEFLNYPPFEDHEFKAFYEFIEKTAFGFECISYTERGCSVGVKLGAEK